MPNDKILSANATLSNIYLLDSRPIKNEGKPNMTMQETNQDAVNTKVVKPKSNASLFITLFIFNLIILSAAGAGAYFYFKTDVDESKKTLISLQNELSAVTTANEKTKNEVTSLVNSKLTEQANANKTALDTAIDKLTATNDDVKNKYDALQQQLTDIKETLSAISSAHIKNNHISEAAYFIELAGRKIWNEHDFATAKFLLNDADKSLIKASDPSLIGIRQAINEDISLISSIAQIDIDGIVLKLMSLGDKIADLPLVNNYQQIDLSINEHDDSIVANEAESAGWFTRITDKMGSILAKFVTIEKHNPLNECLKTAGDSKDDINKCYVYKAIITPEQAIFIRENIKLKLLIAAQAVPRFNDVIYHQALNDAFVWLNAYFETTDASVKVLINDLSLLSQESIIKPNVPEQLKSQIEITKLMAKRFNSQDNPAVITNDK